MQRIIFLKIGENKAFPDWSTIVELGILLDHLVDNPGCTLAEVMTRPRRIHERRYTSCEVLTPSVPPTSPAQALRGDIH